jgi:hypothetical protein
MTGQRPSLCRFVLVPAVPAMNNGSPVAVAVITGVNSDTSVNVRVLFDGNSMEWRTSLALVDTLPVYDKEDDNPRMNVWCWPPRV